MAGTRGREPLVDTPAVVLARRGDDLASCTTDVHPGQQAHSILALDPEVDVDTPRACLADGGPGGQRGQGAAELLEGGEPLGTIEIEDGELLLTGGYTDVHALPIPELDDPRIGARSVVPSLAHRVLPRVPAEGPSGACAAALGSEHFDPCNRQYTEP